MTKRLTIYEDSCLPAGSVVIGVTRASGIDAAGLTLSVARRSNADRPFLGVYGWQAAEYGFAPVQLRQGDGDITEMIFGSELTRHLGEDMGVALTVASLGISERHFWPGISAEPESGGLNLQDVRRAAGPVTKQVSEQVTPLEAAEVTEPVSDHYVTSLLPAETMASHKAAPRWLIPLAALLLFVVIGAGAGYYFWNREEGQAVTGPSTTEPEGPDFASRYRDYLAQEGQAEALFTLGNEALAANAVEVGFNAITLSADRGLPAAKLKLGQWYDPLSEQRGPVRPNPNSAAVYYAEASSLGAREATAAMQRLCQAAMASPVPEWSGSFDQQTHCP